MRIRDTGFQSYENENLEDSRSALEQKKNKDKAIDGFEKETKKGLGYKYD